MINYSLLNQCPIFKGITEDDSKSLLSNIHFQVKKYGKDELIIESGSRVSSLFIVLAGSVRGEMIDYSGKTIKIEDIKAPRPLATAFLFGKNNFFPVTVTANEQTTLFCMPRSEFLKLLQKNEQFLRNYLDSISTRAQFLSEKLKFLSFKTIKEKVAHFLLQKTDNQFHSFELKHTQQQLADIFGVTRPSLARVLSQMQQEKLIKIQKRTITLLNKKSLNELLQNK